METRSVPAVPAGGTQQSSDTAGGVQPSTPKTPALPLASELPAWDLLPTDILLVRRRLSIK